MTMLRFLSKLKWLALIGIWGSFSGNEKFRLFYLFLNLKAKNHN